MFYFIYLFILLILERESKTSICCSTYLDIHWLILVCALTVIEPATLACWDNALTNWTTLLLALSLAGWEPRPQSDFKKSQVVVLVHKDCWYQELINQTQPYHTTWPRRYNSITQRTYLWFKTGHSQWTAIAVLAVVNFLFDNLKEKRSVPLSSWILHILKILVAHLLKYIPRNVGIFLLYTFKVWLWYSWYFLLCWSSCFSLQANLL